MNNKEKQAIKEKLEAKRAEILGSIDAIDPLKMEPGRNPDRADLAQSYAYRERQLALQDVEQEQLEQVGMALKKLEEGTYGICANCGQEIQPERLEIMPYATLCVSCQQQQDVQGV